MVVNLFVACDFFYCLIFISVLSGCIQRFVMVVPLLDTTINIFGEIVL